MRFLTLCVILAISLTASATVPPAMEQVRALFSKATESKDHCEQLIQLLNDYDESTPLLYGYKGCATMVMANHVFSPFSKYNYFKKGKTMLEKAIGAENGSVELRFLRYCTQKSIPFFLGYRSSIETDKAFILKNLGTVRNESLKQNIADYLATEG